MPSTALGICVGSLSASGAGFRLGTFFGAIQPNVSVSRLGGGFGHARPDPPGEDDGGPGSEEEGRATPFDGEGQGRQGGVVVGGEVGADGHAAGEFQRQALQERVQGATEQRADGEAHHQDPRYARCPERRPDGQDFERQERQGRPAVELTSKDGQSDGEAPLEGPGVSESSPGKVCGKRGDQTSQNRSLKPCHAPCPGSDLEHASLDTA